MKQDQRGVTPVIIVGALVILAIAGFAAWRVLSKNKAQPMNDEVSQAAEMSEGNQAEALQPGELIELDEQTTVKIITVADLAKLPPKTPAAFKAYLQNVIETTEPDAQCDVVYTISRISTVNIGGSVSGAGKGTITSNENCGGGAAQVWHLDSAGQWQDFGFQDSPPCADVVAKKIYSEFLEDCYDPDTETAIANPVGSLTQLQ